MVRNGAFEIIRLPAQLGVSLLSGCERFCEFFLETLQRVVDDHGMQNSLLQAGQELALEIKAPN